MRTCKLSSVFCVSGRWVSPVCETNRKDCPLATDSLLYCPAGNTHVQTAAIMVTTISMVIGPGNDLLFGMKY